MIQRVQSVFIFLMVLGCSLLLVFPYKVYSAMNPQPMIIEITLLPLYLSGDVSKLVYIPALLNLLILILSLLALFSFKKRKKQLSYLNLTLLLSLALLSSMYFLDFYSVDEKAKSIRWAFILPALNLIFSFLASHFIKKDEELVRSADRLR